MACKRRPRRSGQMHNKTKRPLKRTPVVKRKRKETGTYTADEAPEGLINHPRATIFSQVNVSLWDRLVSQSSSSYCCIIECLTNYGKDALETLFSAGLLYKDAAGCDEPHWGKSWSAKESRLYQCQ